MSKFIPVKILIRYLNMIRVFVATVLFYTMFLHINYVLKPFEKVIKVDSMVSLINEERLSILSRVNTPNGYRRVLYIKGTFEDYLRNYKLKPFDTKIINYDGTEYFWQYGPNSYDLRCSY